MCVCVCVCVCGCMYVCMYVCVYVCMYRVADKSLARPTSRCILFDGENISFHASRYIYINSTNILPIMIVNRMYVSCTSKSSVAVACFLPGRAKDLPAPLYVCMCLCTYVCTCVRWAAFLRRKLPSPCATTIATTIHTGTKYIVD